MTYNRFDRVYTLNREAERMLNRLGQTNTGMLGLGVDVDMFSPSLRDDGFRRALGLPETTGPLLIYAGRLDNEKRAGVLVKMFKHLPSDLGAAMVLVGDGKLRDELAVEAAGLPIAFPGFERNRRLLARTLASSDIYVSGMADETFGISVLEAQASGLPVVGVNSGAMPDRVPSGCGLLGPVDCARTMADNVVKIWRGREYRKMSENAVQLATSHNRWKQTFEQLIDVEYAEAFASRDARLGQTLSGTPGRAVSPS